jgi:transcriptional regulator with XRE-family HTH domain
MLLAWTARSCTMEHMLSTLEDEVSLRMGRAVKQRREAAGFSLRMLAARSGISSSMISNIERGTKSPTVTTVVRLAQALGVTAAALIDGGTGPAPRIRVLRHGEGAGGEHPAPWESLGPAAPDSRIDFVRYQIPPSTVLGPTSAHAPGTVEHMHVATGTVRVTVGDETAELFAGDSCSCRTDAPHGVENPDPSAEALIYLIVERG